MKWIKANEGVFNSLRIAVKSKMDLTQWVIGEQGRGAACLKTSNDLSNIQNYMNPSPDRYNRICDLQGFFMNAGGFVIIDPDDVLQPSEPSDRCHDPYNFPTTEEVNQFLIQLSDSLNKACGGAPTRATLPQD